MEVLVNSNAVVIRDNEIAGHGGVDYAKAGRGGVDNAKAGCGGVDNAIL